MERDHNGHRKRIRRRALSVGAESLQPHELVEYLLFFAVPRHNTNPLSHRLLNRFGSLRGLFHAGVDELMQVEGMNAASAEWLHLVGQVVLRYAELLDERPVCLTNRLQTRVFLQEFYDRPGVEGCWLLCLNGSGQLTHVLPLGAAGDWHSSENLRRIVSQALNCHACSVILTQQRDEARMDDAERRQTEALMHSLSRIHVAMLEHVVLNRSHTDYCYATLPEVRRQELAEQSPILAHWLDET